MATRAAAHGKGEVRKELHGRVHMWKRQQVPVHGKGTLTSWRWVQTGTLALNFIRVRCSMQHQTHVPSVPAPLGLACSVCACALGASASMVWACARARKLAERAISSHWHILEQAR